MILKITGIIILSVDQYSQTGNQDQEVDQMFFFVRDSSSEYLLKQDNQDILLVGEESCTAKKNTPYICYDAFYELPVLLIDECGLSEAGSPTEPLLVFQEIYNWFQMFDTSTK